MRLRIGTPEELVADLPSILDAMRSARVTHALCISVDLAAWPGVHALALAHHGVAIVVLGFAIAHWRGTVGPYPAPARIIVAR